MSNSCSTPSIRASNRWRLRPRDFDFTMFTINDFATCDTHLVNEDGNQQVIRRQVFNSKGFSNAFRRTVHLFQQFLDPSDIHKLQQIFPDWHPYYNDMPLCTPLPCLYRRLHGFGRDHIGIYKDRTVFLTAQDVRSVMRMVCKLTYPNPQHFMHKNYMQIDCHSNRVTAAVVLHNDKVPIEDIAQRLRWSVESVQHYLRDTFSHVGTMCQAVIRGAFKT